MKRTLFSPSSPAVSSPRVPARPRLLQADDKIRVNLAAFLAFLPALSAGASGCFAAPLPPPAPGHTHAVPSTLGAPAAARPEVCLTGECGPAITRVRFQERDAYRLSDGRVEAIVVPSLGRIMSYGLVGGPNLLWNAVPKSEPKFGPWVNYGGDKTWLAPQASWSTWHTNSNWPPDPDIDGQNGSRAEILSGGKLRLVFPVSQSTGIALTRDLSLDGAGELVIEQTATKLHGAPLRASLWSITQVVPGEAFYLPINSNSPYKKNFHWLGVPKGVVAVQPVGHNLLRVSPQVGEGAYKLGVDSAVSSLVSVRDQVAFLQQSAKPKGEYPDGAEGAGFPVELYVSTDARLYYAELELLSPLLRFVKGSRWKHTVRWSLHALPSADLDSADTLATLETLIHGPAAAQ